MKRSFCVLWVLNSSRQLPKSLSASTNAALFVPSYVEDPGVPSRSDQTSSPAANSGGIKSTPSVIALFMKIPFW